MFACLCMSVPKYAHACLYMFSCVGKWADSEVERESDSKQRLLSVIKLHTYYVAV